MSGKRRKVVFALGAAGVIGLGAPIASAHSGQHETNSGLININDNNVPIQACNNNVPVNVLGGQGPVDSITGALGAGSSSTSARSDSSCDQQSHTGNEPTDNPTHGPTEQPSDEPTSTAPDPDDPARMEPVLDRISDDAKIDDEAEPAEAIEEHPTFTG